MNLLIEIATLVSNFIAERGSGQKTCDYVLISSCKQCKLENTKCGFSAPEILLSMVDNDTHMLINITIRSLAIRI